MAAAVAGALAYVPRPVQLGAFLVITLGTVVVEAVLVSRSRSKVTKARARRARPGRPVGEEAARIGALVASAENSLEAERYRLQAAIAATVVGLSVAFGVPRVPASAMFFLVTLILLNGVFAELERAELVRGLEEEV